MAKIEQISPLREGEEAAGPVARFHSKSGVACSREAEHAHARDLALLLRVSMLARAREWHPKIRASSSTGLARKKSGPDYFESDPLQSVLANRLALATAHCQAGHRQANQGYARRLRY